MLVDESQLDAARPPRRVGSPRRVVVAVAALVVAVAAVAFDARVLSYQPIGIGTMWGPSDDVAERIDAPGYRGAFKWTFERNETWGYYHSIENRGDRAVRITDLPALAPAAYWTREALDISENMRDGACCVPKEWAPFEPFTLEPGDFRLVRYTHRFADCDLPSPIEDQGVSSWQSQIVEYEVYGIGRRVDLQLPVVIAVNAGGECK